MIVVVVVAVVGEEEVGNTPSSAVNRVSAHEADLEKDGYRIPRNIKNLLRVHHNRKGVLKGKSPLWV